jgi:predicted RNase H-related nuclease YkuK (DUF458 family)
MAQCLNGLGTGLQNFVMLVQIQLEPLTGNFMKTWFKSLTTQSDIELLPYVKTYLEQNPDMKIYIGTDSQNLKTETVYAQVVVLHNPRRGGHVLYAKSTYPKILNRFDRLWREVELSIELAEQFRNYGLQLPAYIDLDLNPDPKYQSNQVLRAALGYVESMGYTARIKPYALAASYVADSLCK